MRYNIMTMKSNNLEILDKVGLGLGIISLSFVVYLLLDMHNVFAIEPDLNQIPTKYEQEKMYQDSKGNLYWGDYKGDLVSLEEWQDRMDWCHEVTKSGILYDYGIYLQKDCTNKNFVLTEDYYKVYEIYINSPILQEKVKESNKTMIEKILESQK